MAARREKFGVQVSEHVNFDFQIEWAKNAHCGWIATKCHSGPNPPDTGHVPDSKLAKLRAAVGADNVGGWGNFESDNDPKQCAWAANGIITARGFKFYIANIEHPNSAGAWAAGGGDKAFFAELRRLQPSLVIWLQTEISNQRDWDAAFKTGAVLPKKHICQGWLPECYLNVSPEWTPEQAIYWAVRKDNPPGGNRNIPPEYVKPTLGFAGTSHVPVAEYVEELTKPNAKQLGLGPGFSIYLGETTWQAEYKDLGEAINSKGIALV